MDTIQKFEIFNFELEFRGVHEFKRIQGEFEFEQIPANSNLHPYLATTRPVSMILTRRIDMSFLEISLSQRILITPQGIKNNNSCT